MGLTLSERNVNVSLYIYVITRCFCLFRNDITISYLFVYAGILLPQQTRDVESDVEFIIIIIIVSPALQVLPPTSTVINVFWDTFSL